jgi:hypothetical protein
MKGFVGRFGEKIQPAAENFSVSRNVECDLSMSAMIYIEKIDSFGHFSGLS